MQRSRPKSDYAGQISPQPLGGQKQSLKPLGRKNGFSGQTTAKFVRPVRHVQSVLRLAGRPLGETARAVAGTPRERDPIGSEHAATW